MIVVVDNTGRPTPVQAIRFDDGIAVVDLGNGAVRIGGPATVSMVTRIVTGTKYQTRTMTGATRTFTRTVVLTVTVPRTLTRTRYFTVSQSRSFTRVYEVSRSVTATRTRYFTRTRTVTATRTIHLATVTRFAATRTRTSVLTGTEFVATRTKTRVLTVTA